MYDAVEMFAQALDHLDQSQVETNNPLNRIPDKHLYTGHRYNTAQLCRRRNLGAGQFLDQLHEDGKWCNSLYTLYNEYIQRLSLKV